MTPDPDLRRRAEQEIERAEACMPPFTRLADLLRDLLALVADQAQQIEAATSERDSAIRQFQTAEQECQAHAQQITTAERGRDQITAILDAERAMWLKAAEDQRAALAAQAQKVEEERSKTRIALLMFEKSQQQADAALLAAAKRIAELEELLSKSNDSV